MILDDYDPMMIKKTDESNKLKVLVLGSTGSGKSSFCNTLIADNSRLKYLESEKLTSFTSHTVSHNVTWFDKDGEFTLIDTPGMNDTEGFDSLHLDGMVEHLKKIIVTLNAFVLTINGSNPRLDDSIKSMLKSFAEMFGVDYLKQTIIVFTRWPYDEKEVLRRKENKDSEEGRELEINKKISELLGFDTLNHPIKCFFLCNSYNNLEIANQSTESELFRFYSTLNDIKKTLLQFPLYYCDKMKKVLSEKDSLKKKLEEQEKKNKLHKIARGGCKLCDCLQYYYSSDEYKKKSACLVAATASGGGIFGGIAGVLAGAGLGGVMSSAMYFRLEICFCSHDKKDHYNPQDSLNEI